MLSFLFCHPERSEGSMSVRITIVSWNCKVLFFNKSAANYMDDPEGTPSLRSLHSLVQNDKVCFYNIRKILTSEGVWERFCNVWKGSKNVWNIN